MHCVLIGVLHGRCCDRIRASGAHNYPARLIVPTQGCTFEGLAFRCPADPERVIDLNNGPRALRPVYGKYKFDGRCWGPRYPSP